MASLHFSKWLDFDFTLEHPSSQQKHHSNTLTTIQNILEL